MAVVLFHQNDSRNDYSFTAASLAAAEAAMLAQGPHDAEGRHAGACYLQAEIFPGLQIQNVPEQTMQVPELQAWMSAAFISNGTLRYWAVIVMPTWTNVASMSRAVQTEWTRFTGALLRHEQGHVQRVLPTLEIYRLQFQNLRIAAQGPNRAAAEQAARQDLRTQVQEVFGLLRGASEERIRQYDRQTNHGRNQGARLITRIQ